MNEMWIEEFQFDQMNSQSRQVNPKSHFFSSMNFDQEFLHIPCGEHVQSIFFKWIKIK